MNSFANPGDALHYDFPEFTKPEDQQTEYAHVEGAVDFQLKDFVTAQSFDPAVDSAPVVQPAVFQDFKEVFPSS